MLTELLLILSAAATASDTAVQDVLCAETGFSRAAEAKDKKAFLSFVDPDARFISSRVARGREEVAEAWSAALSPGGPTMRWRPAFVEVAADGNIAISRGPWRSSRLDENGVVHYSWGHFISTWRRSEDGKWQVLFDTGGDNGMEPSERDIEVLQSEPECP